MLGRLKMSANAALEEYKYLAEGFASTLAIINERYKAAPLTGSSAFSHTRTLVSWLPVTMKSPSHVGYNPGTLEKQ
jgi:hypothetical protein